jgi:NADH:ubiquinone oxidoreductase subunit 4 (subunit M)
MLLTWLILTPLIGGVAAWLAGRRPTLTRSIALAACAFQLAVALWAGAKLLSHGGSIEQQAPWIPALGVSYHLAMDGLSLLLVALTGLLGMVAVVCSWREVQSRVGAFYGVLLAILAGVTGVFLARDLLLFYFLWELMLVPMYFLIAVWGHERRNLAAIKFFLFTFIPSLLMLAGGRPFGKLRVAPRKREATPSAVEGRRRGTDGTRALPGAGLPPTVDRSRPRADDAFARRDSAHRGLHGQALHLHRRRALGTLAAAGGRRGQ